MSAEPSVELLSDTLGRVRESVVAVLDGIPESHLTWRADPHANTVAWIVWHLTRVQDDHLAAAFDRPQVWEAEGWAERFDLPYPPGATGYGMTTEDVGKLSAPGDLLLAYHQAVTDRSLELLAGLRPSEFSRVVDERWDPPVTLGARLVSVVCDDLEHVGQAAYVRGMAERAG